MTQFSIKRAAVQAAIYVAASVEKRAGARFIRKPSCSAISAF